MVLHGKGQRNNLNILWNRRTTFCTEWQTFVIKWAYGWRRGVAVERRIRDREVAGSSLGRALRRKNSGQVSHTYG